MGWGANYRRHRCVSVREREDADTGLNPHTHTRELFKHTTHTEESFSNTQKRAFQAGPWVQPPVWGPLLKGTTAEEQMQVPSKTEPSWIRGKLLIPNIHVSEGHVQRCHCLSPRRRSVLSVRPSQRSQLNFPLEQIRPHFTNTCSSSSCLRWQGLYSPFCGKKIFFSVLNEPRLPWCSHNMLPAWTLEICVILHWITAAFSPWQSLSRAIWGNFSTKLGWLFCL